MPIVATRPKAECPTCGGEEGYIPRRAEKVDGKRVFGFSVDEEGSPTRVGPCQRCFWAGKAIDHLATLPPATLAKYIKRLAEASEGPVNQLFLAAESALESMEVASC